MKTARLVFLQLTLLTAACDGAGGPNAPEEGNGAAPTPIDYVMEPNVHYGMGPTRSGSVSLLLDLCQPNQTCTAPRPTIDYRLTRDDAVISTEFAQFAADHAALVPTDTPERMNAFAAAVEDAVRALRWIEANASRFRHRTTALPVHAHLAGGTPVYETRVIPLPK